jgi:large subunit ribosomal protein L4
MANVSVFDMQGKEVGKMDLADSVFGVEVNEHLLHLAVVAQLANKRQGTQKALTRSEVSGGGRKPWRQKGTGHARQGSIRAPQWKGGGVVFAPVPRDYTTTMNKKEKRAALKSALSNAVAENKLIVVDAIKFDEIKTKNFKAMLDALKVNKAFVVLDTNDKNAVLSARNIPAVKTAQVNELNVYDVLKYQTVVATKAAVEKIQEVYA